MDSEPNIRNKLARGKFTAVFLMPRGYRCVLVAFVGWLSLANAQTPRTETKQPEAQSNQSNAATAITPPPAQAVEPIEPSELNRPCDPSKDQRKSDLCAQWKAADAARDAANWTQWGVILGVFGTIGLFWTLYYTRKAVLAAEDATKDADAALTIAERNAAAATRQAETSETTAKHQLRAYVGFSTVHLVDRYGADPRFHAGIRNFGQTPALGVAVHSVVSADAPGDAVPPYNLVNDFGTLEPSKEQGVVTGFSPENFVIHGDALTAGARILHWRGLITYRDIYDRAYIKEFIVRISPRRINNREPMIAAGVHIGEEEIGEDAA